MKFSEKYLSINVKLGVFFFSMENKKRKRIVISTDGLKKKNS